MTPPGTQATCHLNDTADTGPLSTSSKNDSCNYEGIADLSLSLELGPVEVLQRFENLATEDGRIPRNIAVRAMKYLHERVKKEAEGKLEDAKRRMKSELQTKLEEHQSNGSQAAADEIMLQGELKTATT